MCTFLNYHHLNLSVTSVHPVSKNKYVQLRIKYLSAYLNRQIKKAWSSDAETYFRNSWCRIGTSRSLPDPCADGKQLPPGLSAFIHRWKGTSETEWDPTVWSGLKHHCALVVSSVLLMEIESLSVTWTVIKTQSLEKNSETAFWELKKKNILEDLVKRCSPKSQC